MKLCTRLLLTSLFALTVVGCTTSKPDLKDVPEIDLYSQAEEQLQGGLMKSAVTVLEEMDKSYPFGPYSQQVQLNLIYSYYKAADLALAIASIDRFLKLNPTHPNIDWVIYLRGLSNMALDDNQIQGWFNVDRSDRDPDFAETAFKDFTYLVSSYPYSPYSYDAQQRLTYLKNRLARYQLKIAQYYTDRQAYVAVINRVNYMLEQFSDTEATREGLVLMKNAYDQLGLVNESQKVQQLIVANSAL
ncbi:outer membrane protein assembly factor BamD [Zophobihabitans entericus]|uniref:Outer membrane protein assembly factor BamD n=1 Tax=Zophobihabitans entericus TaxID=1635327 RepID=A0A6G9ICA1_9GAMM|nr:outer membrane protein assembly factor BamD [Zophobihabitans entericus]QIQ21843.1 outer membrane protein assembly factor BamD [Zophobihabitans entericus]